MSTCPPFRVFGSIPANCHKKQLWTPTGLVSTRPWGRRGASILAIFASSKVLKPCNCRIFWLLSCSALLLSLTFGHSGLKSPNPLAIYTSADSMWQLQVCIRMWELLPCCRHCRPLFKKGHVCLWRCEHGEPHLRPRPRTHGKSQWLSPM